MVEIIPIVGNEDLLTGLAKLVMQGAALEGSCGHVVPYQSREQATSTMGSWSLMGVTIVVLMGVTIVVLMVVYAAPEVVVVGVLRKVGRSRQWMQQCKLI